MVRVLRRTIILFALGLFINIFPTFELSGIRIPGVLQRIAICYFFASLIALKTNLRGRILWLIGLLASYWLMMRFIPVPGIGAGVLEPGKILPPGSIPFFCAGICGRIMIMHGTLKGL